MKLEMPDSARMQQALYQPLLHGKVIRLGLMIAFPGDLCCVLFCVTVPFILRRPIQKVISNSLARLICTE
jgi:hypothetical protein